MNTGRDLLWQDTQDRGTLHMNSGWTSETFRVPAWGDFITGIYLKWHYHWDFTFWRALQGYLTVKSLGQLRKENTTLNTKANISHMPWDILEGRNRDGELRDGKFSSCKITVISITGIQSTAVQRGSAYTLPASYLHSSRNGTRRGWHHGPRVWTIPLLLPFGSLHLGAERLQGCPAKCCPCTALHGVSSKRHLESCHVQNQPPPGPRPLSPLCQDPVPAAAPPQLQPQCLDCKGAGHHLHVLLHTNWPKGIHFCFNWLVTSI